MRLVGMALKRVYLDQRDWITLARQHYGRTDDKEIADVLALVREASAAGHASFPLSAAHYVENSGSVTPVADVGSGRSWLRSPASMPSRALRIS